MRRSFSVLATAFLVGVALRSVYAIGLPELGMLVSGALVLFAVAHLQKYQWSLYVVLALAVCVLGVVRTEVAYRAYESVRVFPDGTEYAGEGVVSVEPDVRDGHTVLWVDVALDEAHTMRLRIKAPSYPRFAYGDQLRVKGMLTIPSSFLTDTGRTFKYDGFLMKDGVHYELRNAVLTKVSSGEGSRIISALLTLKQSWLSAVSQILPEPEASLAGGVIVGAKQSLGEKWLDAFRETGLIHIVVLSGYNLTLVANVIVRATGALPRMLGFGLGALGVVCFALMTGGGATVARASVMAILGMLATFTARPYVIIRVLALAAVGMVLWNPFVLVYDSGFQLSFMATVGLILGAPLVERFITKVPTVLDFRGILAATVATQIAVLPLLLYQIGQVSLVAPLVNMLVLPLVAYMMLLGFLAGLVGMVSATLAYPLAWLAHILLGYTFVVVDLFGTLSFASVVVPPVSVWVVGVLYAVLAVAYVRVREVGEANEVVGFLPNSRQKTKD